MDITQLSPAAGGAYQLLDSGDGRKLEQFGDRLLVRPEPQALWRPEKPEWWQKADAIFAGKNEDDDGGQDGGQWQLKTNKPDAWLFSHDRLTFQCRLSGFRHVGVFPEQSPQWQWLERVINAAPKPVRVLNLFAYTGVASVVAAAAGAHVTHVDSAKKAIQHARDNAQMNNVAADKIRWICDDVRKFVGREVRRGAVYEMIILDPPKFGRGAQGEVWKFFEHIHELMIQCESILSDNALGLCLTSYALRASSLSLHGLLHDVMAKRGGSIVVGELVVPQKNSSRALSCANFGIWSAHDKLRP